MSSPGCVRISSQELAQLKSSVKTFKLPSRQDYESIEARYLAERQKSLGILNMERYGHTRRCLLNMPQWKDRLMLQGFDIVSKDAIIDDQANDVFLPYDLSDSAPVLTFRGRIAIPQDQIYDTLCYCHLKTDHGDDSQTLAFVRNTYIFVPSRVVREFVDACPACATRRAAKASVDSEESSNLVSDNDLQLNNSFDLLSNEEREGLFTSMFSNLSFKDLDPETLPAPPPLFSRLSATSRGSHDSLPQSLPMSREVSLFQGLPNGWQYFTDYDDARKDFVENKEETLSEQLKPDVPKKRPRIPSIAPLRSANFNIGGTE